MKTNLIIGTKALAAPTKREPNVLAFAGSTQTNSLNKKLIQEAAFMAREMGAKVTVVDLKDYPMAFYDAEAENREGMPANAKRFQKLMIASDAIFIASPEYNASFPAVLKNAIDWASRSSVEAKPSRDAFKGKKFVIMSDSPGNSGGARVLPHLRSVIQDIGGEVLDLQVSVPQAGSAFDAKGHFINAEIKRKLQMAIQQMNSAYLQA